MELETSLGRYWPAFFAIELEFSEIITIVQDIPAHLLPTFYHEYFHFLQDVTTPYGLHFAWATINAVSQSVASLQTQGNNEISIPILEPQRGSIIEQVNILKALNGESKVINLIETTGHDRLSIKSYKLEFRPELAKFDPEQQTRFLLLTLQNGSAEYEYWFGANAIIEGMAELIEEKHFGLTGSPQFPYQILQQYITHVIPELRTRKDIMFVLADISLLTNNPGFYLNDLLVNSNLRFQIPDNPNDVYSLAEDYFQKRGYDWQKTFFDYKEKLLNNINQIFGHEVYANEIEWLNTLINEAYLLRKDSPHFMLEIYSGDSALSRFFMQVIEKIGTPDIVNFQRDRFFSLPASLNGQEENIHPIFMTALQQFFKDLLYAQPRCQLLEICKNSEPKWVNQNCLQKQWDKVEEETVCPLTSFYRAFGFSKVVHAKA